MERQRKIKIIVISALVVSIVGLSIAFAALSKQLTITGSSSFDRSNFDVHFEYLQGKSSVECIGDFYGTESICIPAKLSDDKLELKNVVANFQYPGESARYNLKIVNNGDLDAKISDIQKTTPKFGKELDCTEVDGEFDCDATLETTQENINWYNENFIYKLIYTDNGADVRLNDTIAAGQSVNVTLLLQVPDSTNPLPEYKDGYASGLTVSDASLKVIYSQN